MNSQLGIPNLGIPNLGIEFPNLGIPNSLRPAYCWPNYSNNISKKVVVVVEYNTFYIIIMVGVGVARRS